MDSSQKSNRSLIVAWLIPVLLLSIVVYWLTLMGNEIRLSLWQCVTLLCLICGFYLVSTSLITLCIRLVIAGLRRKRSPFHSTPWLNRWENCGLTAFGATFVVADIFRISFLVTHQLPMHVGWLVAAALSLVLTAVLTLYVYHWLGKIISRSGMTVPILLLLLLILVTSPLLLKYRIVNPLFHAQDAYFASHHASYPSAKEAPRRTDYRVMLYGIDGATWDLAVPLLKMGRMPVFEKLCYRGVHSQLKTLLPTLSPVIWTTISTGMLPEKHGIKHFARFQIPFFGELPAKIRWPQHSLMKQAMKAAGRLGLLRSELYTAHMRRKPALYNMVSRWNESVLTANWWCSWPVNPLKGAIVSERFSYSVGEAIAHTEAKKTARHREIYPEWLSDSLSPLVRKPENLSVDEVSRFMRINAEKLHKLFTLEHKPWFFSNWFWFRTVYQSDRSQYDIARLLMAKYKPRLFLMYQQVIDVVSHHYWQYLEPHRFPQVPAREVEQFRSVIPSVYDYQDKRLGYWLENNAIDTLVVVSDHGMQGTGKLPKSADHVKNAPPGIFIAWGKPFLQNLTASNLAVTDIAPLVLTLMGLPVAQDMDGRIPPNILTEAFLRTHPPTSIPSYSQMFSPSRTTSSPGSPTDRKVLKMLKGLGYLD